MTPTDLIPLVNAITALGSLSLILMALGLVFTE